MHKYIGEPLTEVYLSSVPKEIVWDDDVMQESTGRDFHRENNAINLFRAFAIYYTRSSNT